MSKKRKMRRKEFIQEISDATELKPREVRNALDAATHIMIREIILNGQFTWLDVFSVKTVDRKDGEYRNVFTGENEYRPPTKYFRCSLSRKINYMNRWYQRNQRNAENGVTPETWRDAYENYDEKTE